MMASRRIFLASSAMATCMGLLAPVAARAAPRPIAPGPYAPTWESLVANYRYPEWFRDAKFGIWAHWSAQCVPEQGDWYARRMYLQGDPAYDYHVKTYGHPSKTGFLEIQNLWRAERWEPEKLIALYKRAGAKYFMSLGSHHDNFDAYDSAHHGWNSVNVGAKKDIVGTWAKAARTAGLRFGISNHNSWAPRWLQPAYGYDGEGPMAGVRYDAFRLTKADGKGTWWEGLDPQDLYTGPSVVIPSGYKTAAAVRDWHSKWTSLARENPLTSPRFTENWFLRCKDMVDKYQPDLVYFDTNELPLEQAGLDFAAHYYNASAARNGGRADVVINGKHIAPDHMGAFVEDIERGTAKAARPDVWQTDTCIGQWHYDRALAERNGYKTVGQICRMLLDIVSKNGNLLLSIPVRGDGTIDEHEIAFLEQLAEWMDVHGEGIFSSRPWKVFGEGPIAEGKWTPAPGAPKETPIPYTAEDIRFTTRDGALYAYAMAVPENGRVTIKSLASGGGRVTGVSLLGKRGRVKWTQGADGLHVMLPTLPTDALTVGLRIRGSLT